MARSDSRNTMAFPHGVYKRGSDPSTDRQALVTQALEVGACRVVVGLPLSLDGSEGAAAQAARREAQTLGSLLAGEGIAVELFDERMTTVSAHATLAQAGKRARERREVVDAAAAVVLLEAWIQAQ
jgi:putative holliday junction resolvase